MTRDKTPLALKLHFFSHPFYPVIGLQEMYNSLSKETILYSKEEMGGLGGGFYDFIVEFTTGIDLKDAIVGGVVGNYVYEQLKSIFKKIQFSLKAISKFITTNDNFPSIDTVRINFQTSEIEIINVNGVLDFNTIKTIWKTIKKNFDFLTQYRNENISNITTPILKVENMESAFLFRKPYNFGETAIIEKNDYFKYWSVSYGAAGLAQTYLFNVKEKEITENIHIS